jgi:hypothetical protein
MFHPQQVLISRSSSDPEHERLQRVPGLMMAVPNVGEPLQMFLETGKIMRTSPVTHVEHDGAEIVVDTRNSRYRLKLAS